MVDPRLHTCETNGPPHEGNSRVARDQWPLVLVRAQLSSVDFLRKKYFLIAGGREHIILWSRRVGKTHKLLP